MNLFEKIIISIPFVSEAQFKADIQRLRDLFPKIEYVEVRFDYYNGDLSDSIIEDVVRTLRSNRLKMIFTSKMLHEIDDLYISSLNRLISHKPDYIDLDLNIIASTLTELAEYAIQNNVAIVYSYHNEEKTPSLGTISDLCEFFIQMLPKFTSNRDNILKMVFMAVDPDDVAIVIEFGKCFGDQGINLISFCMGELGKTSRIQSIINGCSFTYAHIGNPTAPGQLHVTEIHKQS